MNPAKTALAFGAAGLTGICAGLVVDRLTNDNTKVKQKEETTQETNSDCFSLCHKKREYDVLVAKVQASNNVDEITNIFQDLRRSPFFDEQKHRPEYNALIFYIGTGPAWKYDDRLPFVSCNMLKKEFPDEEHFLAFKRSYGCARYNVPFISKGDEEIKRETLLKALKDTFLSS